MHELPRRRICNGMWLAMGLAFAQGISVRGDEPFHVGGAWSELQADDQMVIGGGIVGATAAGTEGRLQATALVIGGQGADGAPTRLCLVGVDVLMMNRDLLDRAARQIEQETGISFTNVLINASHTHHAPSTVTVHGYQRDEEFCRRTVDAIVATAREANAEADRQRPATAVFRLSQEASVGQNSRVLRMDGQIYWIGPQNEFVRPTGPFDSDLLVLAFRRADGSRAGAWFNHSTHCIGTRTNKKSPGFYGLAAQQLADELGAPLVFLSGAAGSTHNLSMNGEEMVYRICAAVRDGLQRAQPMSSTTLAATRRELSYRIRQIDEAAQSAAIDRYCAKHAPAHHAEIARVFRESRDKLRPQQGQERKMWLQAIRIGDVYLAACPAEFFTTLGIEVKRRSPHRHTFVLGLTNDYCGYTPNREAFALGGYQTWAGLHNFAEEGTGERIVDELVEMLEELP